MKKKISVDIKIKKINELLESLNSQGYGLDFVENTHVIVHWESMKKELTARGVNGDISKYVYDSLKIDF